ncbi:hypothetical protein IGB42_04081 [Andreprevotia sp. IGB-42]|uniref:hypothetical protein n=1 Tax=Andreprevotia sp. IGB-42 TaxID=2497473 RepID=UPI00135A2C56|nr:hypothetical protein [Andreprevotia sp. IGB-42]KAF0811463.1 hypothetical protein IGB42_04081 [Andreprevotia sp. IGB-42]
MPIHYKYVKAGALTEGSYHGEVDADDQHGPLAAVLRHIANAENEKIVFNFPHPQRISEMGVDIITPDHGDTTATRAIERIEISDDGTIWREVTLVPA